MRDYIKSHGVVATAARLAFLVPAFEGAWAAIGRDPALLSATDLKTLRERLASEVVDIVLSGEETEPSIIAHMAIKRVRRQTAQS